MHQHKILLIENSQSDIFLMKEALKEVSKEIILQEVHDGEAAMQLFKKLEQGHEEIPDIILLDLNLPKVKGFPILEYVKNSALLKKLPIIVMATSPERSCILQCYELGANAYLLKPKDFGTLVKSMTSLINFWLGTVILPHLKMSQRH